MLHRSLWFSVGLLTFNSVTATAAGEAGAGLTPWQRPEGAPVITSVDHGSDWFRYSLTGISRPYPASLRFLDDQGNWHTPFNRPGMTGRYDIRGWHQRHAGKSPE
ncbi:MAG: hypothetical protein JSW48_03740 [Betaproteobacteria bacterium]|nr:MAG: hypothetical protein JSW48_03740 [Betaproteobacteria bacterium]